MVDALRSERSLRKEVQVRLLFSALFTLFRVNFWESVKIVYIERSEMPGW